MNRFEFLRSQDPEESSPDAAATRSEAAGDAIAGVEAVRVKASRTRIKVIDKVVYGARAHASLLTNTASLAGTTVITAGLGVLYWAVAARMLPARLVGEQSGLISAVIFAGTVGMSGSGSLLIAELPRRGIRARAQLISSVTVAVAAVTTVLAFVWLAVLKLGHLGAALGSPLVIAAFVVGVVATAVTMALDSATIGLLHGGLQMYRNVFMAVSKAILLPVLIVAAGAASGSPALYSWVVGTVVSVAVLTLLARRQHVALWAAPDWVDLKSLGRASFDHSALTLSLTIPRLAIPVGIASLYRPEQSATFYIAWMVASMLYLIPGHLSTVLFAIGKGNYSELAAKLRFTLSLSGGLGGLAALFVAVFASSLLGVFGSGYSKSATTLLVLLCLGFPGNVFRNHYVAVARVQDDLQRAWKVMIIFGIAELVAVTGGGYYFGLTVAVALLTGIMTLEGIVVAPAVLRAVGPSAASSRTGRS